MVGLLCLRQGHDHGVIGGETSTELRHSALIKLDTAPDFEVLQLTCHLILTTFLAPC